MKTNNYDAIAPVYDFLSRMIFLKAQVNAQLEQLSYIKNGDSLLIIGGGTGWILEEITAIYPTGLRITYIERSEKMLGMASKRNCASNEVVFINAGIEAFKAASAYDVILTAFLFDNFAEERAWKVFKHLDRMLKKDGLWLFSDFKLEATEKTSWKHLMLHLMYTFFRRIAHVEARQLTDMEPLFLTHNYHIVVGKAYYGGFIKSIIFQKSMKLPTFS